MKKLLIHRIREGEFEPSEQIQKSIDKLVHSHERANQYIKDLHSGNERHFDKALTKEFRYFARSMRALAEQKHKDEQKKLGTLRKEFTKIFGVDVWDEVLGNYEFDSLEEFFDCAKLHVRKHYA